MLPLISTVGDIIVTISVSPLDPLPIKGESSDSRKLPTSNSNPDSLTNRGFALKL